MGFPAWEVNKGSIIFAGFAARALGSGTMACRIPARRTPWHTDTMSSIIVNGSLKLYVGLVARSPVVRLNLCSRLSGTIGAPSKIKK